MNVPLVLQSLLFILLRYRHIPYFTSRNSFSHQLFLRTFIRLLKYIADCNVEKSNYSSSLTYGVKWQYKNFVEIRTAVSEMKKDGWMAGRMKILVLHPLYAST